MSDWQPIETAPKDGSWIIGFDGRAVLPFCWESAPDDFEYAGWCVAGSGYGGVLYSVHNEADTAPTHWMPLPKPPVCSDIVLGEPR